MAAIQTVITLTHGKEVYATITNKLLKPSSKPREQIIAMTNFLDAWCGGDRQGKLSLQINSGDAVSASATVTVASGAAGDTAVVSGTTFTAVDHRETTNVTVGPDVSGSLNNTYFTFQDQPGLNKYAVWFNINSAGVQPVVAGVPSANMIKVSGATNVTAATLATAITTACNAILPNSNPIGVLVTNGASTHVIFTDQVAGVSTKVTDGSGGGATGFTFSRTITGSAVSSVQYNIGATDTLTAANLAAAINANSTMNQIATATSAAAVVTVSSWFPGAIGNYITLTATTGNTASAATLGSGAQATTYSSQNTYHYGV